MALGSTLIHVTESLGLGGAEIIFVDYINALPTKFTNIVVYLRPQHTLLSNLHHVKEVICLNYVNKYDIARCAIMLHRIIQTYNADLVHSHLYWPTIIARLAMSGKVPLLFSVHSLITHDAFNPNILSKYLEKITYSAKQTAVFVSQAAYNDYTQHIAVPGEANILYNFVGNQFFNEAVDKRSFADTGLKLVAVGNLRPQKGHLFLLKCLRQLRKYAITLDIYGEGHQREELENYIREYEITNVRLLGSEAHLEKVLPTYDVFVLASRYEGFCIAMAEAMAIGLPCLVPNLEVLQEVSGERQLYFEQDNEADFLKKIQLLYHEKSLLTPYADAAREVAAKYRKETHIQQLVAVYEKALKQ
ncbi:glycosyltransferase [Pontibacter liquoris]|uniref:glycosyltransferase n=1 Tax=Pontibacter liquoris TaxID=2905677 RepID=UPI001FA7169C|nr:glycosyltransferase [Pontibacter liquoris]